MPVAPNLLFNVLDLVAGILLIIEGCLSFTNSFAGVILPLYQILFGLVVCLLVFYVPMVMRGFMLFYFNLLGRGLAFLFLGVFALAPSTLALVTGIYILILAFFYIILWILTACKVLICGLPPPFLQMNQAPPPSSGTSQTTQTTTTTTTQSGQIR